VFQDLAGARLYQAPEHKLALSGAYTFEFAPGALTLAAGYVWTDEIAYQPFKSRDLKVPAYGVADLSGRWTDARGRFAVLALVKNLFEEVGYNSTGSTAPTAVFDRPNSGLEVGGSTYLRQTRTAVTRGLIAPRTVSLELQLRF
jgi:iron complex outermembrane receptor protein